MMKRIAECFRMDGKVAVITGASSGMGLTSALAIAQQGGNIVNVDIDVPNVEARSLIEAEGVGYHEIRFDLAREFLSADRIVDETVQVFGKIDVLINCAGLIRLCGDFLSDEFDFEKHYQYVVNVNMNAPLMLCRAAIKQMIAQGHGGKIINFASSATARPGGQTPTYSMTKAAITIMTASLAISYGKYGIQCNTFAPGITLTNFLTSAIPPELRDSVMPQIEKERGGGIPMGRCQTAEDIMGPVLLLASDANAFMNGAVVRSDGGQTIV